MSSISTICNVAPGLKYYSCTSPNFTGCCSENPCTDSGCPDFGSCNADKGETVCGFICCPSDYGCGEWGQFCNDTNGSIFQPAAFTSNPPLSKTAKSTTSSPSRKSTSTSSFIGKSLLKRSVSRQDLAFWLFDLQRIRKPSDCGIHYRDANPSRSILIRGC